LGLYLRILSIFYFIGFALHFADLLDWRLKFSEMDLVWKSWIGYLTVVDFAAAMAEVTPVTMSDWVSGTSLPHDHLKVEKLCRALGCDFQWLLTGIHSRSDLQNLSMSELFESEDDPMFSGVFEISARRLKRKAKG